MGKHSKIWLAIAAVVSGITSICATVVVIVRFVTSDDVDVFNLALGALLPTVSLLVHVVSILRSGGKDTPLANILYKVLSVITILVSIFTIFLSIHFVQNMLRSW